MVEQELFDKLIKKSLIDKSEEIIPQNNMKERVSHSMKYKNKSTFNTSVLNWKRAATAAACFIFICTGVSLAVSPEIQTAAVEKVTEFTNRVQMVFNVSQEGSATVSSSEITSVNGTPIDNMYLKVTKGGFSTYGPIYSREEAEKEAGFKFKMPVYLPSNCKLPTNTIDVSDYKPEKDGNKDTGKHAVSMQFDDSEAAFSGTKLLIYEIDVPEKDGYKYMDVKIGNNDAKYYETQIDMKDTSNGKDTSKEVYERQLRWKDNEKTYILIDYSGISKDELIKMAESMK